MAKHISPAQWARYKNIVDEFHDDANQDNILWYRQREIIPRHMEDESNYLYPIQLKVLNNYNYFRTWPLTEYTHTGENDKESVMAIFNVSYLKRMGYTDEHDKFIYKEDKDVFMHRGDLYKGSGGTFVSQAHEQPLHFIILLKRETNIQYNELPPWQGNGSLD